MAFRSVGKLRYSPQLLGGKQERWWIVIDCDPEIGKYYRELYRLEHHGVHELLRPAWDSHITVLRNEEPPDEFKSQWGRYEGWEIPFVVFPPCETDGYYVWVSVESGFCHDLRKELGLSRWPLIDFHVSIGHTGIKEEPCENSCLPVVSSLG